MNHLRRESGMGVALLVVCGLLWWSNPAFSSQSNVADVTRQFAMLGTFAVGLSFVIITGGIDLSVGSMIGLTGVLIAKFSAGTTDGGDFNLGCYHLPLPVAIALAVGIVTGIGLLQGLLITLLDLQPFIITLGGMLLLRGVSQTIVHSGSYSLSGSPIVVLSEGGLGSFGNGAPVIGFALVIFAVVAAVAAYLLHFTVFGRYVYAIGGNREAARYSGINVKRVETLTYVISAFTAAIAGVCYAAYTKQMNQKLGLSYELYAIAAAVLGGVSLRGGEGTVLGVMIGTMLMRVIRNGINMFQVTYHETVKIAGGGTAVVPRTWNLEASYEDVVLGAVILIAVILDQTTHIVQARRRRMKVVAAPPPVQAGTSVIA